MVVSGRIEHTTRFRVQRWRKRYLCTPFVYLRILDLNGIIIGEIIARITGKHLPIPKTCGLTAPMAFGTVVWQIGGQLLRRCLVWNIDFKYASPLGLVIDTFELKGGFNGVNKSISPCKIENPWE